MKPISQREIDELLVLTATVQDFMGHMASSQGIALSVYYSLFVGEMVAVASQEGNFEGVMELLKRDRERWDAMLKAKDAHELYEIAKFTADYVGGRPTTEGTH